MSKRKSCVIWTIEQLIKNGVEIPKSWNGYTLGSNDNIINNEEKLIDGKQWYNMFNSFLEETKNPRNGDVICHPLGAGIIQNNMMCSINKLNTIVYREIPKRGVKFYKVVK